MDIPQPKSLKILLIGDTCVDEYIYGSVDRLSPEAPVMILRAGSMISNPGMAGNVKENLESFNCDVYFLHNNEIITKTRYVDKKSGYHLLRVDKERPVKPWSGNLPFDPNQFDAVIFSDYDKGFVTYEHIIDMRKRYHGPIFVDTKKTDLKKISGCYVKINESEFNRLKSYDKDFTIVTLGSKGATFKDEMYPAPEVEVFDVCGAGDTFLSALAVKFLESNSIEKSIEYANRAAAIAVKHNGVYVLTKEDIINL
jgi:bifunctional ADP-heptose synthase (sugar kinase/adenylyltransferase)